MNPKLSEIEIAVDFASSSIDFESEAYLEKKTGKIHFCGDFVDEAPPSDLDDVDKYMCLTTKQDLGLGKRVALDFASEHLPEQFDEVYDIFRSRGAYARFKSLLARMDALESWYEFENDRTRAAVIEWCKEEGVDYTE